MKPVLHMHQLRKNIDGINGKTLFSNITTEITEPAIIALLGVSGQGKSTLLRILASLDHADEGEIRLNNIAQCEMDPRLWRMKVCYVAQQSVMLPGTIEQNLKTVSMLHRIPYEDKLVNRLLPCLGLEHLNLGKRAEELSGGEKQRIALLRALLLRPEVLLLDEITASLDGGSKLMVEQVLMDWHEQEGTTMIWITHDIDQARKMSGSVWFMGEGTLLENSLTPSFFENPTTELARNYIRTPVLKE